MAAQNTSELGWTEIQKVKKIRQIDFTKNCWNFRNILGENGTLFLQNGQKYVGGFLIGRPNGQGILFGPDGAIIKNGTFGTNEEESTTFNQPLTNDGSGGSLGDFATTIASGGFPRIFDNLNLKNNKYTNLLRKIAGFAGVSLPFRWCISFESINTLWNHQ